MLRVSWRYRFGASTQAEQEQTNTQAPQAEQIKPAQTAKPAGAAAGEAWSVMTYGMVRMCIENRYQKPTIVGEQV